MIVATRGYFVKRYPWVAFRVKRCLFPRFFWLSKPHTGTTAVQAGSNARLSTAIA
jgi:hypothetical protein